MKSENREATEGTEQSYQESIRKLGGNENYKYLQILDVDTIKQKWKER